MYRGLPARAQEGTDCGPFRDALSPCAQATLNKKIVDAFAVFEASKKDFLREGAPSMVQNSCPAKVNRQGLGVLPLLKQEER